MNKRKQDFINSYLMSGNATQAAIDAGYSERTAHSQGPRLLKDEEVIKAIEKFQLGISQQTKVTIESVVADILKIAHADIRKLYDGKGNLKPIHKLEDDIAFAVSEITETLHKGRKTRKLKLYSRQIAQDQLMKHIGGYVNELSIRQKLGDTDLEELANTIIQKGLKNEKKEG